MRPIPPGFQLAARMLVLALVAGLAPEGVAAAATPASPAAPSTPAATTTPAPADDAKDDDDDTADAAQKTPEQKMQGRFPQPVRVGDLIGQPVLTGEHETLGYVRRVVRTADGKIKLIVPYRPWLGWAAFLEGYDTRPVAVPLEVVGSMGAALSAIDWDRDAFNAAPTWAAAADTEIPAGDVIRIAIARE